MERSQPLQHGKHSRSCWRWALVWVRPGLGMFTESFYIFSTGQTKSIWKQAYPVCWMAPGSAALCPARIQCRGVYSNTPSLLATPRGAPQCDPAGTYRSSERCSAQLLQVVSYGEFAGIMAGMLLMGFVAVRLGLKWTSVLVLAIMGVGAVLMTASSSAGGGPQALFTMFAASYALFGFGVGGEYPTAAVGHTERHSEESDEVPEVASRESEAQPGRGRAVQLMFSMQGCGAVVGSLLLCILLAALRAGLPDCGAGGTNEAGYDVARLEVAWRLLYGLGLLPIAYTLFYRIFVVKEPEKRAEMMRQQALQHSSSAQGPKPLPFTHTLLLFLRVFWPRLLGCSVSWFLWDVCFYGNKLFSAPIFGALLGPQVKLLPQNLYILLNNVIALLGYWLAALVIDWRGVGRVRLQTTGFMISALLFLVCGAAWFQLNPAARMALYLLTSLWGQLGPNATTYVLPSESFPSEVRTVAHGISAFSGKAGALVATIWFERVQRSHDGTQHIFLICAITCLLGALATQLFCCNLAGLDLRDQEEHWVSVKAGTMSAYTGPAVSPANLSLYERYVLRWGRRYVRRETAMLEMLHRNGASAASAAAAAAPARLQRDGAADAAARRARDAAADAAANGDGAVVAGVGSNGC